jgi:hypothetical protein
MFAEECKKLSGTVLDVPASSVKFQMPLGRDRLGFGLAYNRGESEPGQ